MGELAPVAAAFSASSRPGAPSRPSALGLAAYLGDGNSALCRGGSRLHCGDQRCRVRIEGELVRAEQVAGVVRDGEPRLQFGAQSALVQHPQGYRYARDLLGEQQSHSRGALHALLAVLVRVPEAHRAHRGPQALRIDAMHRRRGRIARLEAGNKRAVDGVGEFGRGVVVSQHRDRLSTHRRRAQQQVIGSAEPSGFDDHRPGP